MKIFLSALLSFLLTCAPAMALCQGPSIPFPGPGMPAAIGTVSVTTNHSSRGILCSNGVTTCNASGVGNLNISAGSAEVVAVQFCANAGCTTNAGCTVTMSDGSNTYTLVSGATFNNVAVGAVFLFMPVFVAANTASIVAGTLTVGISGTSCTLNFVKIVWAELAGANTTTPVDSAITNKASGTSAAPSVTSAGNVSKVNEVGVCLFSSLNTSNFTFSGDYTLLDSSSSAFLADADKVNPTVGATTTCTGSQTSNSYWVSVIGIQW